MKPAVASTQSSREHPARLQPVSLPPLDSWEGSSGGVCGSGKGTLDFDRSPPAQPIPVTSAIAKMSACLDTIFRMHARCRIGKSLGRKSE